MCTLFTPLVLMEASGHSDETSPRGVRRRNAMPNLFTDVDEGAMERLRCLYRECVAAASQQEDQQDREGDSVPAEGLPLDRLDVLESPRYTRRRNAVPDLAAQLGAAGLRNHQCCPLDSDGP